MSKKQLEIFSWYVSNSRTACNSLGKTCATISWYGAKRYESIIVYLRIWMKSMANGLLLNIDYNKTTQNANYAQEEDSKWERLLPWAHYFRETILHQSLTITYICSQWIVKRALGHRGLYVTETDKHAVTSMVFRQEAEIFYRFPPQMARSVQVHRNLRDAD